MGSCTCTHSNYSPQPVVMSHYLICCASALCQAGMCCALAVLPPSVVGRAAAVTAVMQQQCEGGGGMVLMGRCTGSKTCRSADSSLYCWSHQLQRPKTMAAG